LRDGPLPTRPEIRDVQGQEERQTESPFGGSPETLAKLLHDDSAKYAKLARELNIRIN
jgi:hypothetical protein